jgi:cytochrome P450
MAEPGQAPRAGSDADLGGGDADFIEEMDRGYNAHLVRDPYPVYHELRRESPIWEGHIWQRLGLPLRFPVDQLPRSFSALGHDAAAEVLRDGERFSSSIYARSIELVMGRTILGMDEPEHGLYRKLLQKGFTRSALERWESEAIRPVVGALVDGFAERGSADLLRELTFPFPVTVIARMLGLPERDLERFHRWALHLISIGFDGQRALEASAALGEYFGGILAERRREPRDDLISVLGRATLDDRGLSGDEIVSFLRLLLPAGAETTYRSSSNLLFGLLSHPDQLEALRRDRSLIPQAIEEGLRWEPPLSLIVRIATRDTEVAGVAIPAEASVGINVAAANHDESRYEEPERFDIFRRPRQHLAFGFGPHRCLGMHLARIETQVVLETLLERLPGLRLDPDAEDVHIRGLVFRSPNALPVRFDPA